MGKAETEQLVTEIDQIRDNLASTIDALIERAHPKSILRRAVSDVKGRFIDESGAPKFEAILPVVAATAGTIAALVVIRRLTR